MKSQSKIAKPKLVESWKSTYLKIENDLYIYPNKLRVLVSTNAKSADFDFSVILKAGSFYERQAGVPQGTAHFLEHVLYGNPNKLFKTREAMDSYTYGNRFKATFEHNATTSRKYLYFYAHGHFNAKLRIIKYILSKLDYPVQNIEKFMEKERKIILSELKEDLPEEKDSSRQYEKFLWGEQYPGFAEDVAGTEKSLKTITSDDLIKYYHTIRNPENMIIAIQTPKDLKDEVWELLSNFSNSLTDFNEVNLKERYEDIDTDFKYKHFKKDDMQSVFFSISYFYKLAKKFNYKRDALYSIMSALFSKIGEMYLREELHLVYALRTFNERYLFDYKNRGFTIECSLDTLANVLDETHYLLKVYLEKFLATKEGYMWFNSQLSQFIFKRNIGVDPDYAENIAVDILDNLEYIFDDKRSMKEALNLTINDLKLFTLEFLKRPPIFYFISSHSDEEIYSVMKSSKFYKEFSN